MLLCFGGKQVLSNLVGTKRVQNFPGILPINSLWCKCHILAISLEINCYLSGHLSDKLILSILYGRKRQQWLRVWRRKDDQKVQQSSESWMPTSALPQTHHMTLVKFLNHLVHQCSKCNLGLKALSGFPSKCGSMQDMWGVQTNPFNVVPLPRIWIRGRLQKRTSGICSHEGTFKCWQMEISPSLSKLDVTNNGKIKSTSQDMSLRRKFIGGVFPW